jgi:hypothetical protein
MVTAFIVIYLVAPLLLAAVAVLYALTRATDRIQLAAVALFACSILYFAQAYELVKRGGSLEVWGTVLGVYSLAVYVCMAALALHFKRWAWRASLGIFGLHALLGLASIPEALGHGIVGALLLVAYLSVGAVGLWALLHRGSRNAVTVAQLREA